MHLHHQEPDVAFGLIPNLGMAAAVADDRPNLDEVLRKHHFLYAQTHDIYLLPSDTSHTAAVRAVVGATREFQDTGLSVAVDPKILLSGSLPATATPLSRSLDSSAHALTGQLHDARQAMDVSEALEPLHSMRNDAAFSVEQLTMRQADLATKAGNHPEGVSTLQDDTPWERRDRPAPPPSTRAQAAIAPSVRRRQHAPTSATDAPADSSITHPAIPRHTR
ncbi:hypothetical protein ACYSUO_23480 [Streptomyces sp. UC4497]